jgi:hypothetical protein
MAQMFSKRHYEAVAREISAAVRYYAERDCPGGYDRSVEGRGIRRVAENLSARFVEDSPQFNRERFLAACGVEER